MVPVNLAVVEDAVDAGQRLVAAFGVGVLNVVVRLAVALFTRQLQTLPVETDGFRVFLTVAPENLVSTSARRVVAVFDSSLFSMTGEGNFLYPLFIVVGKMLDNTRPVPPLNKPPEPVVIELQPAEAQQQVVPHRVTVFFRAVACGVPEGAFFLLRFDDLCDLARRVVAPQVLAVFFTRRCRRGIGVYLLDYLVGAVPAVAALEHQLPARVQHRTLGDGSYGVIVGLLREPPSSGRFPGAGGRRSAAGD